PGGVGEVGDLLQAGSSRAPRAVPPVALHAVLPEEPASRGRTSGRRGRWLAGLILSGLRWLGFGRLGGNAARRVLGQLTAFPSQLVHLLLKTAKALIETGGPFPFLLPRLFHSRGKRPNMDNQAAGVILADLATHGRHLFSLTVEDARQQLRVASLRLPGRS